MFTKNTYINRRNQLKKEIENGIILFLGNNEMGMNYADNTYHFRQDSTFLYFWGLNNPNLFALIDLDEDQEIIFGNELTIDSIVWMGTLPTIKQQAEKVGIHNTQPISKLEDYLNKATKMGRKIHFLPCYRDEHKINIWNFLKIAPNQIENHVSVDFIKAVVKQRNYKSNEEIIQIEEAVNTTADMHIAAMKMLKHGMKESEIASLVQNIAISAGGQLSFPVIATINGQTLHNHYHGNTAKDGDLFLLDCGAENALCYAGDMSSTIPVSGRFTEKQKEIYQITLNAHNAAIDSLKPGVNFRDVHLKACLTIAEGLKELGFMKGDMKQAVQEGAHALFFQCGLGHMMGLDVHDMENLGEQYVGYNKEEKSKLFGLKSLRLARELEPGFVLTIEPGIYFIPELIDLWKSEKRFTNYINYNKVESYKDFGGIRNEEDFLITETGYRLLGKEIPKSITDVEEMCNSSIHELI